MSKDTTSIILIILNIIVIFLIFYKIFIRKEETKVIHDANWPFLNFLDENNNKVNILCMRGLLQADIDFKLFNKFREEGYKIIGCSSYLTFPFKCNNPTQLMKGGICYEEQYLGGKRIDEIVDGWLHCFKNSDNILSKHKLLLSESDFMDSIKVLRDFNPNRKKYPCYCIFIVITQ